VQLVVERARAAGVVGNDLVAAAIDRQAVEPDRSDDGRMEAGRVQLFRIVPTDGIREIVGDAEIEERGRTVLEPAPDDVVAVSAVDDVVTEAADQDVVALRAPDDVVVRPATIVTPAIDARASTRSRPEWPNAMPLGDGTPGVPL